MTTATAVLARGRPAHAAAAAAAAAFLLLALERALLDGGASVVALLLWTGLAVPAYALARPDRLASAAALTLVVVLTPASVHALESARDAGAALAGATAVLLGVRALERRAPALLAAALVAALLAAGLDARLLLLAPALALGYAVEREHLARLARWPGSAALALGLAALYPLGLALASFSDTLERSVDDPERLLAATLAAGAAFAFGTGVVPWLLAWTAGAGAHVRVLAWTAPTLAVSAALAGGGLLDDRTLVPLVPLVAALAVRTWEVPRSALRLAGAAAAAIVCVAGLARLDAPSPTLAGAPGLALLDPAAAAGAGTALGAIAVLLAFAALADRAERGAAWLAVAVVALVVGTQLLAFGDVRAG